MLTRFRQVLFGLDVAVGVLAVMAMIVTQIVGYTLFVTIANRCVMFDALRGEASVWAAPVQPGSAQPVRHYTYDARTGITVEQIFARHGDAQDTLVQTFGFGYGRTNLLFGGPPVVSGRSAYLLVTPYWFIALIAAIWPARWLVRFIKHHGPRPRIRRGFVPAMRT